MSRFHALTVADVRRETADAVSIALTIPEDLQEEFQYLPGQYITLKAAIKGEEVRRSYSLCSSPDADAEHRIAVKKVKKGKMSTFLNEALQAGAQLEVSAPEGRFHPELDAGNSKHYICFAAGSGITPMMGILKSVMQVEPNSKVTLLYGNTNEDTVIFAAELQELDAQHGDRLAVHHIYSKPKDAPRGLKKLFAKKSGNSLNSGRLDARKVKDLMDQAVVLDDRQAEYFVCGPGGMMSNVITALSVRGVADEHIHREYFTTDSAPGQGGSAAADAAVADLANVEVTLDGESHQLQVEASKTILEAAQEAGIDAPFSCQGGVCSTCMARVSEGQVKMAANFVLTDKEIAEGLIVTCQAHATTPVVKLSFDDV